MTIFKKKDEEKARKTEREKVEERREEVLARGRRFKYPLQYAKHKVVTLTIFISAFAILAAGTLVYFMLYKTQSTSDLMYHITQILPYSVAKVDGEKVRYSDYLLIYRSSITPIKKQGMMENGQGADEMAEYYKREALNSAEDYTYALKLAREMNLQVSNEEIDRTIEEHRKAGGVERSNETFVRILQDNFGISLSEYRRMVYLSLISQKVSENIDETAKSTSEKIDKMISAGKGLSEIAESLGDKVEFGETSGAVDKMNVDGGRATAALKLENGKTSARFISNSGDGYYYVTLIDKTESTVNYKSIFVPFSELKNRIEEARKNGKIEEMIEIEKNDDGNDENGENDEVKK